MHPVRVKVHHWFVPNRLIWDDWEDFITGGNDGNDSSTHPTIDVSSAAVGSLADYLGVPTSLTSMSASALPFRAYALIYNEFYRDQDLVTALTIDTTSGSDTTTNTSLQKVAWEKDYFTSARAWTQRGTEVSLPLGTTAPVTTTGDVIKWSTTTDPDFILKTVNASGSITKKSGNFGATEDIEFGSTTGLQANLSGATASTIIDLREAIALQKYKEARARYGARYTEYLRYLGVKSADSRLQRPEYLGCGS